MHVGLTTSATSIECIMSRQFTTQIMRTEAFILAGGRGERLHPLTLSKPKPAVSFGGMFRMIDFTLSNCLHSGLSEVSVITQYRLEEIHQYLRQGWGEVWNQMGRRSIRLLPPVSGKRYRGTADAIFQNRELFHPGAEFVLILAGDHIYHMDYRELLRRHIETSADLTIAAVEHPLTEASHFGVIDMDRDFRVIGFEEKPSRPRALPFSPSASLVSMGIYVFTKKFLLKSLREHCELQNARDFGHDIIPSLIHCGRTYAYDFRSEVQNCPLYWRDIGTLDGYYQASMDLLGDDAAFDPFANDRWPSQPTRHPSRGGVSGLFPMVDGDCDISRNVLSPGVHVEKGASVEDSILLPGVRICKGARLRRVIVDEGVRIPAGFQAGFDIDDDRKRHSVTRSGVVVINQPFGNGKAEAGLALSTEYKGRGRFGVREITQPIV